LFSEPTHRPRAKNCRHDSPRANSGNKPPEPISHFDGQRAARRHVTTASEPNRARPVTPSDAAVPSQLETPRRSFPDAPSLLLDPAGPAQCSWKQTASTRRRKRRRTYWRTMIVSICLSRSSASFSCSVP
jgi:hypothetical protein